MSQKPTEFVANPSQQLYCKICDTVVSTTKRFHVESHRRTKKHSQHLSTSATSSSQQFIQFPTHSSMEIIYFMLADISLHKLRNSAIKSMFEQLGHTAPSESSCRNYLPFFLA